MLQQPISTGAAAGFSLEEALYAGLCEAIERDAYMIAYMNSLSLPRIDVTEVKQPDVRQLVESFRRYRLRLELLDMTTDIKIPSILALVVDESSDVGAAVGVGAKVDTDPLWAIRGAIEEVWHTYSHTRIECFQHPDRVYRPWKPAEVLRPEDRLVFWARPEMRQHISFFLKGPVRKYRGPHTFAPRDPHLQLRKVIEALEAAGLTDLYYRDLTLPSLGKISFRVVCTLVPGLTHMFLNEQWRATGSERLRTVPPKMGYKSAVRFNPVPHPFS